ncbi:adenosylmethionine decarboxylase proenzyme [Peptoclostridium litorale DSM 5388]|uniref:S-adenosylmethionine decarboxylase proenzyme n=1 Tax=Peptoclostridium litorale DSM 5388 TaxID=1121324 RepID=A0A069RHJ6_PEPLI|nr:adenosylmethionine decarboxylase [Peptoclostridium litorale]KDR96263.1 S-adenosylmethionine decarboxylase proenzyme [Peptoclostridium litorale DSM 5388]SIO14735.1 adenosylmethionine decarboxylase proenzyme [Peptoclostridium litorale DSM 5388]
MKIEQLGRHIIAEFYNCDREIVNNHALVEQYMNEAAEAANATIVTSDFHMFNPWGVSGAVIIQESHLTIHTWPEYGYAAVDLFTCGDSVNPWVAFEYLAEKFDAQKTESTEVPRGIVEKIKMFSNRELGEIKYKTEIDDEEIQDAV